jgi:hypothetical protein
MTRIAAHFSKDAERDADMLVSSGREEKSMIGLYCISVAIRLSSIGDLSPEAAIDLKSDS